MPESKWVREEDQPAMTCALASCERGARRYPVPKVIRSK